MNAVFGGAAAAVPNGGLSFQGEQESGGEVENLFNTRIMLPIPEFENISQLSISTYSFLVGWYYFVLFAEFKMCVGCA